jgi:hypothetical protein
MISFFYTLDYDDGITIPSYKDASALGVTKLGSASTEQSALSCSSIREYAIAEKYDIKGLKTLARFRLSAWLKSNWNHPEFYSVVEEAYNSTPSNDRDIRDLVEGIVKANITKILHNDKSREMLTAEMGELGVAVLSAILEEKRILTPSSCVNCSRKLLCGELAGLICRPCHMYNRGKGRPLPHLVYRLSLTWNYLRTQKKTE